MQLDPTGGPKDMFGQSPNVLDVGPVLFAQPRPNQVNFRDYCSVITPAILVGGYWREGSSD